MRFDLKGKRALVTGASSGIGRAIALELAGRGAVLAISARRADALESLADEIVTAGGKRPVILTADLSKRGEAARLGREALALLGGVDLLINNAGVGMAASQVIGADDELARELFETNYWSPLALMHELVPEMRARGAGAIVNVSSIASFSLMPLVGHYSSSKAALSQATEHLRLELRDDPIHVLHVMPGPVETGMLAEVRAVPGGAKMLKSMPRGKAPVLAKKIADGLERGRRTLVYPGALAFARHFPTVVQRLSAPVMRAIDIHDERKALGGSHGDPLARAARDAAGAA